MEIKEFFKLKFPTWIELEGKHENHKIYQYLLSARRSTRSEKTKSVLNLAAMTELLISVEVMHNEIREFHYLSDKDAVLTKSSIEDAKKKKVLPKKYRHKVIEYIFEPKKRIF